ncbi:hypothetical protein BDP27DRAFT_1394473 [Rhodocollybia butyracea]|uniref:Uncharacterized protein n=1 Tax=Rhodocollybia butyracea TaxID=206335 RepID=A0A9P5TZ22_9AGAR|nr:hypothetical protein BDP27DRAFT_1394473 [Rhodocollybia butyracea]
MSAATPESHYPYPPTHKDKKEILVLPDSLAFQDGTITTYNSNDYSLGFGRERRRELNIEVLEDRITYAFREMLASVTYIKLYPGFKELYTYGMMPTIRAVLTNLVGEDSANEIEIISNEVDINPDGTWEIKFRHPTSGFGHDKSQAILPYHMYAAKHADVLFVKEKDYGENNLAAYCTKLGINHILFSDFSKALPVVQDVVRGEKSVNEVLSIGHA